MRVQISSVEWVDGTPRCGVILIGRSREGRSVALFANSCPVYFYAILNVGDPHCKLLGKALAEELKENITWVLVSRTPCDHYREQPSDTIMKIEFPSQNCLDRARKLLETPLHWYSSEEVAILLGRSAGAAKAAVNAARMGGQAPSGWHIPTADARVDAASRALVDAGISPEDWLEFDLQPVSKYDRLTSCQEEYHVRWSALRAMRVESAEMAPKVMAAMYLDAVGDGSDVESRCIAASLTWCTLADPTQRQTRTLRIAEFSNDEAKMLKSFTECMSEVDPDVIVGHGSHRFALPWLLASRQAFRLRCAPAKA